MRSNGACSGQPFNPSACLVDDVVELEVLEPRFGLFEQRTMTLDRVDAAA